MDGVQVFIDFDPDKLQVVNENGNPASKIKADTSALDLPLLDSANNTKGTIAYAAGRLEEPFPSESFTLKNSSEGAKANLF